MGFEKVPDHGAALPQDNVSGENVSAGTGAVLGGRVSPAIHGFEQG